MWHLDLTIGVGSLLVLLGLAWKGNRVLNRWIDLLGEYPLHKHVGNEVFYPKGMKPEDPQKLEKAAHA